MPRALVCEDDVAIRSLVVLVLRREGYEVEQAVNGTQGIEILLMRSFDLIVLDLMMPNGSGHDVMKFLASSNPSQISRIVVMSAATSASLESLPPEIGGFLRKPFDIEVFLSLARSVLAKSEGSS